MTDRSGLGAWGLKQVFWTETVTQEGQDREPEVCPQSHLGRRFGPIQQGLGIARLGPAPSPWDRCQADNLTWKLT